MKVLVVAAKNKRTREMETRRWSNHDITREDAIAQMGYWLTQLGWDYREISIMSAAWFTEDEQSGLRRMRLLG